jgi:hypothetical protein
VAIELGLLNYNDIKFLGFLIPKEHVYYII